MILKFAQISLPKSLIFFKKAKEAALELPTNIPEAGYIFLLQIIVCTQTTSVGFPRLGTSRPSLLLQLANQAPPTVGQHRDWILLFSFRALKHLQGGFTAKSNKVTANFSEGKPSDKQALALVFTIAESSSDIPSRRIREAVTPHHPQPNLTHCLHHQGLQLQQLGKGCRKKGFLFGALFTSGNVLQLGQPQRAAHLSSARKSRISPLYLGGERKKKEAFDISSYTRIISCDFLELSFLSFSKFYSAWQFYMIPFFPPQLSNNPSKPSSVFPLFQQRWLDSNFSTSLFSQGQSSTLL